MRKHTLPVWHLSVFILVLSPQCLARGATWDDFSGQWFRFFEIIIFCFLVILCDVVHDVKTIFHLSYVLTASGNLF